MSLGRDIECRGRVLPLSSNLREQGSLDGTRVSGKIGEGGVSWHSWTGGALTEGIERVRGLVADQSHDACDQGQHTEAEYQTQTELVQFCHVQPPDNTEGHDQEDGVCGDEEAGCVHVCFIVIYLSCDLCLWIPICLEGYGAVEGGKRDGDRVGGEEADEDPACYMEPFLNEDSSI